MSWVTGVESRGEGGGTQDHGCRSQGTSGLVLEVLWKTRPKSLADVSLSFMTARESCSSYLAYASVCAGAVCTTAVCNAVNDRCGDLRWREVTTDSTTDARKVEGTLTLPRCGQT